MIVETNPEWVNEIDKLNEEIIQCEKNIKIYNAGSYKYRDEVWTLDNHKKKKAVLEKTIIAWKKLEEANLVDTHLSDIPKRTIDINTNDK